jgi:hypothetical protein
MPGPRTGLHQRDDVVLLARDARRATGRVFGPGERPRAVFYTGPTGAGKSMAARATAAYPDAFRWAPDAGGANNWFDGYADQEVVLVDEAYNIERGCCKLPFQEIKMFLDWYEFIRYQTKAPPFFVPVLAKTFVFTSCVHPNQWYVTDEGDTEPEWARRIRDFIIVIDTPCSDVHAPPPPPSP